MLTEANQISGLPVEPTLNEWFTSTPYILHRVDLDLPLPSIREGKEYTVTDGFVKYYSPDSGIGEVYIGVFAPTAAPHCFPVSEFDTCFILPASVDLRSQDLGLVMDYKLPLRFTAVNRKFRQVVWHYSLVPTAPMTPEEFQRRIRNLGWLPCKIRAMGNIMTLGWGDEDNFGGIPSRVRLICDTVAAWFRQALVPSDAMDAAGLYTWIIETQPSMQTIFNDQRIAHRLLSVIANVKIEGVSSGSRLFSIAGEIEDKYDWDIVDFQKIENNDFY